MFKSVSTVSYCQHAKRIGPSVARACNVQWLAHHLFEVCGTQTACKLVFGRARFTVHVAPQYLFIYSNARS